MELTLWLVQTSVLCAKYVRNIDINVAYNTQEVITECFKNRNFPGGFPPSPNFGQASEECQPPYPKKSSYATVRLYIPVQRTEEAPMYHLSGLQ